MKTTKTADNSANNSTNTNTSEHFKTVLNINFYVMKKQILFLLVAFMATASAFGQTVPRAPICDDTPLNPIAGKNYTYAVNVAAPYTTPQAYDWYVTDDPTFITGSVPTYNGLITNAMGIITAGSGYHDPAAGSNSVQIMWSGLAVANAASKPYFLVINYKGTNGTLCEAMNMKVYKIEPKNAFTLDITNVNATTDLGLDGSNLAVQNSMCASDIASASYIGSNMVYDYGVNYLVFKVVAANFTKGWTPSIKVSGLNGGQTVGSIEWSSTTTFTGTGNFTDATGTWIADAHVPAPADNLTDDGEAIYVRVAVNNGTYEGIANTPITIAVDGETDDLQPDVHYADCLADGFTNDVATQVILGRPNVTSNTVDFATTPNTLPFILP